MKQKLEEGKTMDIALTPPMGWNSWNCYGPEITQEKIKIQAKALVSSGLKKHGYVYVNIDDGWQGERGGKYNAIQGNPKFPDIQDLCDYLHDLGLKVGIYSTPWCKSHEGYTGSCGHEKEDAMQWAEWGVDLLKYDWDMWDPKEPNEKYVKRMRGALDATQSKIIFSLSNAAPIFNAHIWSKYANMWRVGMDIRDKWENKGEYTGISHAFDEIGWRKFVGPGHWSDPDMLVVGYVGWGKKQHPTQLTQNEQITHVTLWSILSAPLFLGCDLTKLDSFLTKCF